MKNDQQLQYANTANNKTNFPHDKSCLRHSGLKHVEPCVSQTHMFAGFSETIERNTVATRKALGAFSHLKVWTSFMSFVIDYFGFTL